jgi:hypothetical protein
MQWAGLLLLIAGLIVLFMSAKDSSDLRRINQGDETVTPISGQTRCVLNLLFAAAFIGAGGFMLYDSQTVPPSIAVNDAASIGKVVANE